MNTDQFNPTDFALQTEILLVEILPFSNTLVN